MDRPFPLASVTKLITATAILVAVEEGTVSLDDPAGPEGATVRHLLAHASGLGFEGGRMAAPERRRIYSNAGFEAPGRAPGAAAGMPFAQYATEAVLRPAGHDGEQHGRHRRLRRHRHHRRSGPPSGAELLPPR